MTTAQVNGIELCFDEHGDPDDPTVLLIMGLGAQMIVWPQEFVDRVVELGHHVVRFDNRDVGLSTKFDDACPDPIAQVMGLFTGAEVQVPYGIPHMAADVAGLLEHLDVDAAHIVGASMGGMIGQQFVIDHSERALSLTSIMSTPGQPEASAEVLLGLAQPQPDDRESAIGQGVEVARLISSPDHWDESMIRARVADQYDRCNHPDGVVRQVLAILTADDRDAGLTSFERPALVVHGRLDPLVGFVGGERTAAALPDVETLYLDDMAHDLPPAHWPTIVDAIHSTIGRAG